MVGENQYTYLNELPPRASFGNGRAFGLVAGDGENRYIFEWESIFLCFSIRVVPRINSSLLLQEGWVFLCLGTS